MDQDNTLNSKLSIADQTFMHCPKCEALYASTVSFCTSDGTKLEQSQSNSESSALFAGKYEILDAIGSGGMSTVYRVRQILIDKICALKVIPPDNLNDLLISRFQREAKTMATLDHMNLGRILDFGIFQNQPYMVMEYIDGIPLSKLISQQQLSVEETLDIFAQILDGLAHAHKKGVLHRDIKPSNIMIVPQPKAAVTKGSFTGRAILLDFGIAKKFDTTSAGQFENSKTQALTRTGEMIGSPLYMCPEQARGEQLTERSDLYSFGCALFECLTGTAPLIGKSTVDTLILHMEKPPPSLKEASLGREYPAGLERAVRKLLSKDPADRYQSADETKRALALALQLDETAVEATEQKEGKTASHTLLILLSVAALLTVSIIAYLTKQGEKTASHPNTVLDEDKIGLEETVVSVADKTMLDKLPAHANPEGDDDEAESAPRKNKGPESIKYTEIKGTEPEFTLRGQSLEDARVKLIENDKNLWGLGLAGAKFPHSMLGNLSPHVGVMRLSFTQLSDEDLRYVGKNKELRYLFINGNPISAKGIRYLTSLPLLKVLDIGRTKCDARAISELRKLPNLKELYLQNNKDIDDSAAEAASFLVGLTTLNLDNTRVTGKGIAHLHRIPRLSSLSLANLSLKDKDISTFPKISNLKKLQLSNNQITSAGIKSLVPLKHLVSLELENNPLDDKAAALIAKMDTIQQLSLSGTILTGTGVMKLAEMRSLKDVYVRRLLGINEPLVYNFMSKCKTCEQIVFLHARGSAYKRSDWLLDEERKSEMTGASAP